MNAFVAALAIFLSHSAHAGLFGQLQEQEHRQLVEQMDRAREQDLANRIGKTRDILAGLMGVDPGSIAYEGVYDHMGRSGFQFRVGEWGCLGNYAGAVCISSQTHERRVYSAMPLKRRK